MKPTTRIYRNRDRVLLRDDHGWSAAESFDFDTLFSVDDPHGWIRDIERHDAPDLLSEGVTLRPPMGQQEVWAAGVTYFRSREARMEESEKEADVYDRVYGAERPELFFKATPHRVVGHGESVAIRADSSWNVPEAELTLAVNRRGAIIGFTIGNDMSSRSIEGENPLYLPQAKVYDGSCALGPCLCLADEPLDPATEIRLRVSREGETVVEDHTTLSQLKRSPEELVSYLFRESSFPHGAFLLTGTGIVPEADFTLKSGDAISITIEPMGTLTNVVR